MRPSFLLSIALIVLVVAILNWPVGTEASTDLQPNATDQDPSNAGPDHLVGPIHSSLEGGRIPAPGESSTEGSDLTSTAKITWEQAKAEFMTGMEIADDAYRLSMVDDATSWGARPVTPAGTIEFNDSLINPLGKALTDEQQIEFRRLERERTDELASLGKHSFDFYQEAYFDFITNEKYEHFISKPSKSSAATTEGSRFWSNAVIEYRGHWIALWFRSSKFPEFNAHLNQITFLKQERLGALQAYVAGL